MLKRTAVVGNSRNICIAWTAALIVHRHHLLVVLTFEIDNNEMTISMCLYDDEPSLKQGLDSFLVAFGFCYSGG